ncbi:MAG: TonB-dependent receptor [Pseudomonadota bacterium]
MNTRLRLHPLYLLVLQTLAASSLMSSAMAEELSEDAPATAPTAASPGKALEVVTTFGRGQTRQVQNISREDLAKVVPGTSPLKTLEKLPGVSFQSADPFGSYEWSTRFSIRGFNQNRLGFTLDDVPLGDMSYGINNGMHIGRAISMENIGRVAVSQGAGSLATASTSNLGGTVQFFTQDPADKSLVTLNQTLGTSNTTRTFVRYDTGTSESGTKAYLSATHQNADKTKGWGPQYQDQFNAKVLHTFGGSRLSAFINTSERHEFDYQDVSLELVKRLGYNWDNYAPDWQRAVNAANGVYSGGVTNVDDAYFLGEGLRKDLLGGGTASLALTDNANLKTTLYHHESRGQGHWDEPKAYIGVAGYTNPIAMRSTEYAINRDGVVSNYSLDLDNHAITAGFWYERSYHGLQRVVYPVDGPDDGDRFRTDFIAIKFKQDFQTSTRQYYVADTWEIIADTFKVSYGFKSPKVHIEATNLVGGRSGGSLSTPDKILPQLGANFSLTKQDDIFASMAKNMRAYQPGLDGSFQASQAGFDASVANLKPETSTAFDLGYRFQRDGLQGSVSFYTAAFSDRLLAVSNCTGIAGCPSALINVGKVNTKGMEAAIVWSPNREWSWFNSITYNDSKYESDYRNGTSLVAAGGKQVVDTPKTMFNTELSYESGPWFGRANVKYTDQRYFTYTNDGVVPAYTVANLAAGYKLGNLSIFKNVTLQVNVTNLMDKQYFSTVGSNGFSASDPDGSGNPTLQTGSPRQIFFSISAKI